MEDPGTVPYVDHRPPIPARALHAAALAHLIGTPHDGFCEVCANYIAAVQEARHRDPPFKRKPYVDLGADPVL